jgi:hypothetical protein
MVINAEFHGEHIPVDAARCVRPSRSSLLLLTP